jgi:hypothetical protein
MLALDRYHLPRARTILRLGFDSQTSSSLIRQLESDSGFEDASLITSSSSSPFLSPESPSSYSKTSYRRTRKLVETSQETRQPTEYRGAGRDGRGRVAMIGLRRPPSTALLILTRAKKICLTETHRTYRYRKSQCISSTARQTVARPRSVQTTYISRHTTYQPFAHTNLVR